jgi:uncharacterized repeat protein (TIGR01451 family)
MHSGLKSGNSINNRENIMKKFIIFIFAFAFASAMFLSTAHASGGTVSFNTDPKDLPTVTVADYSTQKCVAGPADGCWQSSTTAQSGDIVSVQIYFHNTGTATSVDTGVALSPENSGPATSHTFNGTVIGGADLSSSVSVHGSATVYTPDGSSLDFIPGSLRYYPDQSTSSYTISGENYLFSNSSGINVGNVSPGWSGQGVLVVDYQVSGGSSPVTTNSCSIDSFYTNSNSITQGQSTTLYWSTSGNGTVNLSGFGSEPATGSVSVSPYSTTTYELSINGDGCSDSSGVTVNVGQNTTTITAQQPQAITTVANVLSSYSAQLNGIAVPNISYGSASAWFEYGPTTNLGESTNAQSVNSYGSYPYSDNISGLNPGSTYYYRAVVQTQVGIAYGSVVPFITPSASVYTPPTKVVYVQSHTTTTSTNVGVVARSQPSLFKLEVDSNADSMCVGGTLTYTVNYQNVSAEVLQNSILRITFPGELTYVSGSQGSYDVTDRTLTIALGDVQPGQTGSVTVTAQLNSQAVVGNLSVLTATMVYTNPATHAQEQAIAYSLITVSNTCPAVLATGVFGFGGFLPTTLIGWLLLILIILALIVLARTLYNRKDDAK